MQITVIKVIRIIFVAFSLVADEIISNKKADGEV